MTNKKYFSLVLILGSMTALAPFSIDMYLPGFPAIAKDLNTTASKVALSLSGFFIGISLGQLLYGPLLDKFGRKPPLYAGLIVYILSSIGCSLANSIDSLILLRFIQALGSCAATVTAVAMVRDQFPVKDSPKVFALLILVLGTSPLIAPTVGGYVTTAFGWHSVFIILAALAVLITIAIFFWLPDPYKPDKQLSLKPGAILRGFRDVLVEPQFYTYAFTGALAFTGLFAYVSGSPLFFMTVFGLSGKVYGLIFAALSIGFVGSSQLNTVLLKKFNSQQIIRFILTSYAIVGTAFLIIVLTGWLTLPISILFIFLSLTCVGITNPNTASLCLAPFTRNAGTASALMGAIQMGLGAAISVFVSLFDKPSALPMVLAIFASSILSLSVFLIGKRKIKEPIVAKKEGEAVLAH